MAILINRGKNEKEYNDLAVRLIFTKLWSCGKCHSDFYLEPDIDKKCSHSIGEDRRVYVNVTCPICGKSIEGQFLPSEVNESSITVDEELRRMNINERFAALNASGNKLD